MSTSAALTLSLLLGAGCLAGQATTNPGTASNRFLDGWMAELLHADRDAAVKAYTEAMKAPNLPDFQSELATLRLWESSWKPTDRQRYRAAARQRGSYTFAGVRTSFIQRVEVDGFAAALKSGDTDELLRLRGRLAELAGRYAAVVRDPRPLIRSELNNFRGETVRVDSQLESLKKQYKEAKDAGDGKGAHEIWIQIQDRQRQKRRTASRRVIAKRWTEMTRLHLEGRHQRASGMEDRLPRFRGQRFTAAILLTRIRSWSTDDRSARLETVIENLDAQLLRRELLTEERSVLQALRQRIEELRAAKEHEQALVLAARTPYRDRLFLSR